MFIWMLHPPPPSPSGFILNLLAIIWRKVDVDYMIMFLIKDMELDTVVEEKKFMLTKSLR